MVIKVGVADIPPLTLAAGRIVLAAIVLTAYVRSTGRRLPAIGRVWGVLFVCALFGNSLPFFLIAWGEVAIDSGLAAILMAVMPLTTLLLAHFFTTDEKLNAGKAIGIAFGFAGVVVLVGPEALKGLGGDMWRQLAVAGGATCYAVASTTARRLPPAPPAVYAAAVMIVSGLQIVPISLVVDRPWELVPTAGGLASLVYLGLFPTALATIIYFRLIADRGATFIALNNYLIPALGVTWGAAFLDERVTLQALAALALILAGIVFTNYSLGALKR